MRIHRLAVEAFGPFADRVEIDLDEVSSAGLFLIHGPTGAGKTSLLDAICFALFADVPGARTKKGLRSDYALPETIPLVELELTVSGRRLRITRSPEHRRPKKRGEGTVSVPASVRLEERRRGEWVAVSTRHDEVADVILDVLGMGLPQFAKVVVLPQGDFAAFLRSSADERRAVLERLFDITTFADVEAWLADHRRATGALAAQAEAELAHLCARIDDVSGTTGDLASDHDPRDGATAAGALQQRVAALAEVLRAADEQVILAMSAVDTAEAADAAAAAGVSTAREWAALRERGSQAQARLAALSTQSEALTQSRERSQAAHRASAMAGFIAAVYRAGCDEETARLAVETITTELVVCGLPTDPAEVESALTTLRGLDDSARRLDAMIEQVSSVSRRAAAVAEDEDGHRRAAWDLEQQVIAARAAEAEAEQAVQSALAARADLAAAQAEVAQVAELRQRHSEVVQLQGDLLACDDSWHTASGAALTAREAHLDLRARHLDSLAAELAGELVSGQPCGVCGSREHPDPAQNADLVSRAVLDQAQQAAETAQEALHTVEVRRAALRTRLEAARAALGDIDAVGLDQREVSARAALELAEQDQSRAEAARTLHDQAQAETARQVTKHTRVADRLRELAAVLAELGGEELALREQADQLREAHTGCCCLHTLTDPAEWTMEVHDRTGSTLDRARQRVLTHARAARAREQAAADAQRQLTQHDFDNLDEAQAAAMSAADLTRLDEAITRHEREQAVAESILAEPDVVAALTRQGDDLPALEQSAALAREHMLAATRAHSQAQGRHRELARLVPDALAAAEVWVSASDRAAAVKALADTVAGLGADNTMRMRLTAYILAARLEAVVAQANERLRLLDAGRYLLEHTDDVVGSGRSGLGLRVLDQWTGAHRSTATLSGGETFIVSLALALGLADAVRAESGGIDLGTLFVDEGFGSLDEDTLEEVLAVLDSLQEGGRAVGVVSHVTDLRARITHQIVVRKSASGSDVMVRSEAHQSV